MNEHAPDGPDILYPPAITGGEPLTMTRVRDLPVTMTPQQARVDAVAALTGVALSKAATLQLTPDETERLTANFADVDFLTGAAGKENLIYIQHAALRDRLNGVLGLGQWALVVRESWNEEFKTGKGVEGVRVYVRTMMLVRGCYVAEAVGDMDYYPSNGQQNFGDAFEGSKTAAFRRCAKEFGVGLQAWRKEWCEGWWARKRNGTRPAAPAPQTQRDPAPAPAKPAAAPTPRAMTPEERRDALFAKLKGFEPEATAIFREEALILATELFTDVSAMTVERIPPDAMLALIKQVKARKADNDQVPGVEAQDEPEAPAGTVGIVEETNQKDGKTKTGKPWVKYGIKIDGNWLNTFSKTDYDTATALKGQQVRYTSKATEYGNDLLTIESAEENAP